MLTRFSDHIDHLSSPDLPIGLTLKSFATKFFYAFTNSPMHAVCPALLILLLCLITTTSSVPLIVSLNTAALTGYPADAGILYEIRVAAVFGDTIRRAHLDEKHDTICC